ncbi:MAG: hypothetical protein MK212_05725 [Saprospiraceae bacterium]|nr:hypothetical protein [Saprospiraceae bacterium]
MHQTFTMDGAENVTINVVGKNVEVFETKGSRVLVEVEVTLMNPNERLLDFIANSGRYNLVKKIDESTKQLSLESKKTNGVIMVKGEECAEELSYRFYIPTNVRAINNSTIENVVGGE